MFSSGSTTRRSIAGLSCGLMTVTGWIPPTNLATSSTGLTVADNPMRCVACPASASSRSRLTARCAPRLVPATAWTSSSITVSTSRRMTRALDVSSRYSDSGVVTRMSGGWEAMARLSRVVVSPLRMAMPISGAARPDASHSAAMPSSGARRFFATSTASAFSGETYSTLTRRVRRRSLETSAAPFGAVMAPEPFRRSVSPVIRRSMAERNAHNVLPEPVGATTRALPPAWMTGHAWLCAAVGTSNACLNHALVGPENRFKHSYIYSIMRCSLDPRHTARRRATYSSTHSSTSPGWHSSASQMPSSVEKRMALARPFFSTETFADVMPTRSASSPHRHFAFGEHHVEVHSDRHVRSPPPARLAGRWRPAVSA